MNIEDVQEEHSKEADGQESEQEEGEDGSEGEGEDEESHEDPEESEDADSHSDLESNSESEEENETPKTEQRQTPVGRLPRDDQKAPQAAGTELPYVFAGNIVVFPVFRMGFSPRPWWGVLFSK